MSTPKPSRKTLLELTAMPASATGADRSLDLKAAASAGADAVAGVLDASAKYYHTIARQLAAKYPDNPETGKVWDDIADLLSKASDDVEAMAKRQPTQQQQQQQPAQPPPPNAPPAAPPAPAPVGAPAAPPPPAAGTAP